MALNAGGGGGGGSAKAIEAGRAYVRLGAKDDLSGHLKKIAAKFMAFGKQVLSVGAIATGAGVGLALAGITAAAGPLIETIQDLGKMQTVADAFGITGRAASGLFGVLQAVGGEFKENLEGVIQFSGTMDKAVQGVGQGAELFDGLAITAKDISNLAVDEQFYRVLGAIRQLPQPLQEAKLAMLGGTDSMKQWQALLTLSEQDVRSLADKLAFSSGELRQAADASKAYQAATLSVSRAWQQVAVTVAPVVKEIAQWTEKAADGFTAWIKGRSAGNILAEVWVRIKQGLFEVQAFGEDAFGAMWEYFTKNGTSAMEVVKQLFVGLFKFSVGSFAKIFPIWTKYIAIGVAATLGFLGGMLNTLGATKEGQELFDVAQSISPSKAAERTAKLMEEGRDDLDKALEGFDQERKKFAAILKAQQGDIGIGLAVGGPLGFIASGRAGERAAHRAEMQAEMEAVQKEAVAQRFVARWADTLTDLYRPGASNPMTKQLGDSLGTFGDGGKFLTQMFGSGDSLPKKQLAAAEKANEKLQNIYDAIKMDRGFVYT